jgi:uncharacterized protein
VLSHGPEASAAAAPQLTAGHAARAARSLDAAECAALIRDARWGVLATCADGKPYAVPVAYGYDGDSIFIAMTDGRKADNLQRSPALCLPIVDATDIARCWRSVVVTGTAEWLHELGDRLRGFAALRAQHGTTLDSSARNIARLARARLLRIRIREITGRAVGS